MDCAIDPLLQFYPVGRPYCQVIKYLHMNLDKSRDKATVRILRSELVHHGHREGARFEAQQALQKLSGTNPPLVKTTRGSTP